MKSTYKKVALLLFMLFILQLIAVYCKKYIDLVYYETQSVSSDDLSNPTENEAPEQEKEIIIYITETGEKYHKDECRYLSMTRIPVPLSELNVYVYSPCSVCNPPEK